MYNIMTTILLWLILREKRGPDNESAPKPWRNGSHIETLTSRRCSTTMDKREWRKLTVQTAVM